MNFQVNSETQAAALSATTEAKVAGSENISQNGIFEGNQITYVEGDGSLRPDQCDDEGASGIQSEKDTKKEQNKKTQKKEKEMAVQKAQDTKSLKSSTDQSKNQRTRAKAKEMLLQFQAQLQKREESFIQERSGQLFFDQEDIIAVYKKALNAFQSLEPANEEDISKWLDDNKIADVAERHNTLMMAQRSLNDMLTVINGGKLESSDGKNFSNVKGALDNVVQEIRAFNSTHNPPLSDANKKVLEDLESKRDALHLLSDQINGKLTLVNNALNSLISNKDVRNRINDSYELGPELIKAFGQVKGSKESLLPSKSLNSIVLDKVIPKSTNAATMFNLLTQGLLNEADNQKGPLNYDSKIEILNNNIEVLAKAFSGELDKKVLQSYGDNPNQIATALRTVLKMVQDISSVDKSNREFLTNLIHQNAVSA